MQVAAEAAYRLTAAAEAQLHARAVRERATAAAVGAAGVRAGVGSAGVGASGASGFDAAAWERREAWKQPY